VLWEKRVINCGLASKKQKRNKIEKTKKDCNCKYNPTAMLGVCGLQPAPAAAADAAAAEAEDDGIEEKNKEIKIAKRKNSEMLMIARLSH
jgi:hypothetical protein